VIDDCSHRTQDHRATFDQLQNHVRYWYAIEDLHATPASVPWLKELGPTFHCQDRLAVVTM
jgi:hypothetical protein